MLTLAKAQEIIAAALAGERSDPMRRVAVAVCDAGAHPLALGREEEAPPLLAHIAQAKPFTCIAYGKPSKLVMEWADGSPNWFQGIGHVAQNRMGLGLTGSLGGVIIRDDHGRAIGAVGVAGEAGPVDEAMAVRGIEAAGFAADPG